MKILHLMLGCFYIDNYSYQENYLPKYHKLQGHDVEIIASSFSFDKNGKGTTLEVPCKYVNENNIPVTRIAYKKGSFNKRLRYYIGLEKELIRIEPELIFIHGIQFCDISKVVKYCKAHKNVKVFADNHSDYFNSASNWVSKHILHRIIWRRCAQKINPYTTKFYGVLPLRVDFLINEYKLPKEKVELLVMGADDEQVQKFSNAKIRDTGREEYGLSDDDIVIMTGGKIDHNKPQTLILMEAVNQLKNPLVKLLIFGAVAPELQSKFDSLLSKKIKYIGWKKSNDIYREFAIADIIAFPGLHSVLWEQAVGMGKPCIFRKLSGFEHIDIGGNCMYFAEDTPKSYCNVINEAIEHLDTLTQNAQNKGKEIFSYNKIAEKSIGGN